MNNLEVMQGLVDTMKMVREMTPETIDANAKAIAAGFTLVQAEVDKRNEYNTLFHDTNAALAQLKEKQAIDEVNDTARKQLKDTLANDQLALRNAQDALVADTAAVDAREKAVFDREAAVAAKEKQQTDKDAQQVQADKDLTARAISLDAQQAKMASALSAIQS